MDNAANANLVGRLLAAACALMALALLILTRKGS